VCKHQILISVTSPCTVHSAPMINQKSARDWNPGSARCCYHAIETALATHYKHKGRMTVLLTSLWPAHLGTRASCDTTCPIIGNACQVSGVKHTADINVHTLREAERGRGKCICCCCLTMLEALDLVGHTKLLLVALTLKLLPYFHLPYRDPIQA
jgi:hypothetical protein